MLGVFAREGVGVRVDYAEVVDAESLLPVVEVKRGDLVAVAAWVGGTRLIDNFLVGVGIPTSDGEAV
jgi:pantoate--beta-alanine ligase